MQLLSPPAWGVDRDQTGPEGKGRAWESWCLGLRYVGGSEAKLDGRGCGEVAGALGGVGAGGRFAEP